MSSDTAMLANPAVAAVAYVSFFVLIVIFSNVFQQIVFKSSNRPPVVFHWLPILGSTVAYGKDPFKFFFDCQARVGGCPATSHRT
jgi:hypothetical protein